MGNNVAHLESKLETFEDYLKTKNPSVFMLQETKTKKAGKIKTESTKKYIIYELHRKKEKLSGGGIAIGVLKELHPVFVNEGDDEVEALTVEIWVEDFPIRLVVAYGPQNIDRENNPQKHKEKKEKYWAYIENESIEAKKTAAGFLVHMDGNLHAGEEIVPKDPNPQNENGKLFQAFLERNPDLTVINSLSLCQGLITRFRRTINGDEKAVLDFFLCCEKLRPYLLKLTIDEDGEIALTNFKPVKDNKRAKASDHAVMELELELKFSKEKPSRTELFNFKNVECQKNFNLKTTKTNTLSKIFEERGDVENQFKSWWKLLNSFFQQTFRKVRIKEGLKKSPTQLDVKIEEWKNIKKKNKMAKHSEESNEESEQKEEELEKEIIDVIDDLNLEVVKKTLGILNGENETVKHRGLWKLKKEVNPKIKPTLPVGKKNIEGMIVTNPEELKELYLQTFIHRLRNRPIKKGFEGVIELKEELFDIRLEIAKLKKTAPWKMEELENVLKHLKNDKSRDPDGLINELFKPEVIGEDLKLSLLLMVNKIKDQGRVPESLKKANISAIPKKKGSRLDIENERGIFICSVIRSILMRLIYSDKYETIDRNMSDSNVGSRRKKSIRNHLFVLNAILNDVNSSNKKKPIDIQQMDYKQMFDSEKPTLCLNALADSEVDDDKLVIIHEANKKNSVAVKTPSGEVSRGETIEENLMQGEVMAPLISSNFVDKFGKECKEKKDHLYLFKDKVEVPPLSLVDDLLLISECGHKTTKMNSFINSRTNMSKLYFSAEKCKQMHVGKTKIEAFCKVLHVDGWEEKVVQNETTGKHEKVDVEVGKVQMEKVEETKYLGSIIQSNGSNSKEIAARAGRGTGLVTEIMNILQSVVFGKYTFEAAIILRNSILLGSMLASSECWLGVTKQQVRQLEMVDEMLMERVLETPSYSSRALLYLSLGLVPIRYILMQRRIIFLHYILNEDKDSLIHQVFQAILDNPQKNDFGNQIKEDLKSLEIELSFEEIKSLSFYSIKKFVKDKILKCSLKYLNGEKDKQDKIKHLYFSELKLQDFLGSDNVERPNLSKLIHNLIAQTIDIKENNPWNYMDNLCICEENSEKQSHIFSCESLKCVFEIGESGLEYTDLFFGTLEEKLEVAVIFEKRLKKRKSVMEMRKTENDLAALCGPSALGKPIEP